MKHKCYQHLGKVPKGKITTYKELAKALDTKAYRLIGTYMKQNTNEDVPCHRVVKSNGEVGNYNKGQKQKILLLKKEGIPVREKRIIDFEEYMHVF